MTKTLASRLLLNTALTTVALSGLLMVSPARAQYPSPTFQNVTVQGTIASQGVLANTGTINSAGGTLSGGTLAGVVVGAGTLSGETLSGGGWTGSIAGSPTLTGNLQVTGAWGGTATFSTIDASGMNVKDTGTGPVSRTLQVRATDNSVNLLDFFTNAAGGNVADGGSCFPVVSIASGSATLTTDGSCSFGTADVGKIVSVPGAGANEAYGSITAIGIVTAGTFSDSLPYVYITGTQDAYQYGGVDAVLTVNGTAASAGSIVGAGVACTTGTFTLTEGPNPVGATAATFTGVFAAGTLSTLTQLTGGSYISIVPLAPAVLTGNSGCTTQPTAHINYTPTSVTVDQGGIGYTIATPGTVMETYGWNPWPNTGTIAASDWTITVANANKNPLIATIGTVVNASTIVLGSAASTTVTSTAVALEYGTPIDTAFNHAQRVANTLGGRCVYIPAGPNGATYIVQNQIAGSFQDVCIEGTPMMPRGGPLATQAQLCANATCLEPLSPNLPTISLVTGEAVHYIHRLKAQYVPASGTFTPTYTPYFIDIRDGGGHGNHVIDHVMDINGTHGIVEDCSPTSGCGNANDFSDLYLGSLVTAFSAHYADNPSSFKNIHIDNYTWQNAGGVNSNAINNWRTANATAFNLNRCDQCAFTNIEVGAVGDFLVTAPEVIGATFQPLTGAKFTNVAAGGIHIFAAWTTTAATHRSCRWQTSIPASPAWEELDQTHCSSLRR